MCLHPCRQLLEPLHQRADAHGNRSSRRRRALSASLVRMVGNRKCLANVLHPQIGSLVSSALPAVVGMYPRLDNPAPIRPEEQGEPCGQPIDLQIRVGAPFGGNASV
jgi:hypothetical protein